MILLKEYYIICMGIIPFEMSDKSCMVVEKSQDIFSSLKSECIINRIHITSQKPTAIPRYMNRIQNDQYNITQCIHFALFVYLGWFFDD